MTWDSEATAYPVGFLPETSFGTALTGCTVKSDTALGESEVPIDGFDSDLYTDDLLEGLRIKIGNYNYVITSFTDDGDDTGTIKVYPDLLADVSEDDVVYLYTIPVQHKIEDIDPQEDRAKDTHGGVGAGTANIVTSQGARIAHISMNGLKGRDMWKFYYDTGTSLWSPHRMSSMLGYIWSADGVCNINESNYWIPTWRITSSVPSFTMYWQTKSNEVRVATGCVLISSEEEWEDDEGSHVKISFEIEAQRIDPYTSETTFESNNSIKIPTDPYLGPFMRSTGCLKIGIKHISFIVEEALAAADTIVIGSGWGFDADDEISIVNHNGQTQTTATIDSITPTSISGSDATGYTVTLSEGLTYNQRSYWSHIIQRNEKTYSVKSMTIKTMSGAALKGDIAAGADYRTVALANNWDLELSISFRRETNTTNGTDASDWYRISRDQAATVAAKFHIYEFEATRDIGTETAMYRDFVCGLVSDIKEPLKDDKEEMIDELEFKLITGRDGTLWTPVLHLMSQNETG